MTMDVFKTDTKGIIETGNGDFIVYKETGDEFDDFEVIAEVGTYEEALKIYNEVVA